MNNLKIRDVFFIVGIFLILMGVLNQIRYDITQCGDGTVISTFDGCTFVLTSFILSIVGFIMVMFGTWNINK